MVSILDLQLSDGVNGDLSPYGSRFYFCPISVLGRPLEKAGYQLSPSQPFLDTL
jgi:hypothetical protein